MVDADSPEELGKTVERLAVRLLRQRGWRTRHVGDHCAEYDYELWQDDGSQARMLDVKYTSRVTFTVKPHQFWFLHGTPLGMLLVGKCPPGTTQLALVTHPEVVTWYLGYANKIGPPHIKMITWPDGRPGMIVPNYVLRCVGSIQRRAA